MLDETVVRKLLDNICVTIGMCVAEEHYADLVSREFESPEALTQAIFNAEGITEEAMDDDMFEMVLAQVDKVFVRAS